MDITFNKRENHLIEQSLIRGKKEAFDELFKIEAKGKIPLFTREFVANEFKEIMNKINLLTIKGE